MGEPVRFEAQGGIATLTLARPEVRNAMGLDTVRALARRVDEAAADESVRLLLLDAEGPAFCAGMDLKSVDLADPKQASAFAGALADLYLKILTHPKPVLCAVDGPVSGGGVGLPAGADLVWAGPDARFALPETRLGLVPALVSVPLRRRVGHQVMSKMAVGGVALDADQAVANGLADFRAGTSAGDAAREFADELLGKHAPGATVRTKRFLSLNASSDVAAELAEARREFQQAVQTEEARRGLAAFRSKEAVTWRT